MWEFGDVILGLRTALLWQLRQSTVQRVHRVQSRCDPNAPWEVLQCANACARAGQAGRMYRAVEGFEDTPQAKRVDGSNPIRI